MKFCRIYRAVIEIPVVYEADDEAAASVFCPSAREMEDAISSSPELAMVRAVCSCSGVGSEPQRLRTCRVCGCSDDFSDPQDSSWAEVDLCSACANKA